MRIWRQWSDHAPVVAAVAVVGAVGILAEARSVGFGDAGVWLPDLAVGVIVAAVGAALFARDAAWSGALLVACGVVWFAGNFAGERTDWIAWPARQLTLVHRPLIVAALLAFPAGLAHRRLELVMAAAALVAVLPDGARGVGWTLAWAIAVPVAFVAVVGGRRPMLWAAGRQVLPVVVVLSLTVVVTAVLRSALGDAPPPRITVVVYQVGIVACALLLWARIADWRRRPGSLADAVVEVTFGPGGDVGTLLAKALRDPRVDVAFAVANGATVAWFDEGGRPVGRLSARGRSVVPILVDGRPVAEVASTVDFESSPALLAAVGSATHLAAEHARLRADLRREVDLLAASRRRLLTVADEERVALASQLEREAGYTLHQIRAVLDGITATGEPDVDAAAWRSRERLGGVERDLDALAAGLGPAALVDGGLADALAQLAASGTVPVSLRIDGATTEIPPAVASTLYFVAAESIANATKHAGASEIVVALGSSTDEWRLRATDDGCGGAAVGAGSGLSQLADRVASLGGRFELDSPAGAGTRLTAEIPRG